MKANVTAPAAKRGDQRHASLSRLDAGRTVPAGESVVFESRGVVLIVGDDASVVPYAAALSRVLKVIVCAPGAQDAHGLPSGVVSLGGRVVSITGRMGAFRVQAAVSRDESADIGRFSPNSDRTFDLVLDLSRTPQPQAVPPLGYFAPGHDIEAIDDALATLPTLVGRFGKSRYFEYAADLCAHGAKGLSGCTRCLEVCSTSAITSAGDVIEVDPYLCQGCATCTLVCPSGALTFKLARRAELITQTAQAIADAVDDGVTHPALLVRSAGPSKGDHDGALSTVARPLDVPALPAFGEELWFAALAQGAAAVVLVADESMTQHARKLLAQRVTLAQNILAAVGAPPERIALATPERLAEAVATATSCPSGEGRTSVPNPRGGKRAVMLAAIDTLISGRVAEAKPLPAGAPFGDVVIDRAKCTVCHACVNLCPTAALIGTTEPHPALSFIEARCVQCGLCEVGCPEDAIALQPRFVADAAARNTARLLHEDELARCTSCGTPFIAARLLATSIARMQDFPGLGSTGGVERLRLCPACRQRESLTAEG